MLPEQENVETLAAAREEFRVLSLSLPKLSLSIFRMGFSQADGQQVSGVREPGDAENARSSRGHLAAPLEPRGSSSPRFREPRRAMLLYAVGKSQNCSPKSCLGTMDHVQTAAWNVCNCINTTSEPHLPDKRRVTCARSRVLSGTQDTCMQQEEEGGAASGVATSKNYL